LIDCGVHARDLGVMGDAVAQLKQDTDGKLSLVIMTHRHADHISGFGSQSAQFKTFSVERVWMSWFEDPKNQKALAIQKGIAATAQRLQAALALRARGKADQQFHNMTENALGLAAAGGNAAALKMLHGFKTAAGEDTPVLYYKSGEAPELPDVLRDAGLEAEILGPPTDKNLQGQMDSTTHEYLSADDENGGDPKPPFHPAYTLASYAWPKTRKPLFDDAAIRAHVDASQGDALAAAAKRADANLNNQSLVVLFTFGGKTMLFAGDAQWGNWENFLFGGPLGTPGHMSLAPNSKKILDDLDFYKVGHHGSRNATPTTFVEAMGKGCAAMCSTQICAYNEVPRDPLMEKLKAQTEGKLARSDQVPVGAVPANADAGTLPNAFRGGTGFVDYLL
jgi:beta-lactamase superfamily II metal-dependent hydrolase